MNRVKGACIKSCNQMNAPVEIGVGGEWLVAVEFESISATNRQSLKLTYITRLLPKAGDALAQQLVFGLVEHGVFLDNRLGFALGNFQHLHV